MKLFSLSALALSLGLFSHLALADVQVQGPVEYGVFASAPIKDPQPGERILSRANQPIEQTEVVPARLGTKFGVRYQLTGKAETEKPLTLMYFTPGLIGPDGKRQDKIELQQKLVVGAPQDVMAFEFTEHHEVVPGEWQFMVFQGDRKLLEQRFTVR
ncbi:DUF3859 domain-containing protein [Pseudomonas sp. PDM15]|jgi:hypothetical protein|uniref:DUF3859 domain-containing protein n=1 Tax=Pseudomonas sp. PDM15 TaxID=2769303 RepID=UPI00178419B0|nr:DUF3859 domain-containing protein [Pseudomonas sp. PDM15]MBD9425327.1 DUF3859 domain-containing protein [Pseudomonas sp. PDM15]